MSEPYVGEIQLFGFSYAPYQWSMCSGATIPIQQNTALFALLGTYYGGNGTTNFQLPNLMGRTPVHQGQGPGLTPYTMGETAGAYNVALSVNEMPNHTHGLSVANGPNNRSAGPSSGQALSSPTQTRIFRPNVANNTNLSPNALNVTGGSQPHNNISPILALNYSIALYGVFPSFN